MDERCKDDGLPTTLWRLIYLRVPLFEVMTSTNVLIDGKPSDVSRWRTGLMFSTFLIMSSESLINKFLRCEEMRETRVIPKSRTPENRVKYSTRRRLVIATTILIVHNLSNTSILCDTRRIGQGMLHGLEPLLMTRLMWKYKVPCYQPSQRKEKSKDMPNTRAPRESTQSGSRFE